MEILEAVQSRRATKIWFQVYVISVTKKDYVVWTCHICYIVDYVVMLLKLTSTYALDGQYRIIQN